MLKASAGLTPPLGISYIAAYVKRNGFQVEILDNNALNLDGNQFEEFFKKKDPLIVGFAMYLTTVNCVLDFASIIKKIKPDIKIIVGGALATNLYKDILKSALIDVAVKGEGERTMSELINAIKNGNDLSQVKGIAYKENDRIRETAERELVENIDEMPFPAYELLQMDKYHLSAPCSFTKNKNIGAIITSRGCPYSCSFCSNIFGKKIRYRSEKNVIAEIKYLKKTYNVKDFLFCDDTFTHDEDKAIRICELIVKNKLDILWSCFSRADRGSEKLYKALYQAGCRSIFFGAESGSQKILDNLNKGITLNDIKKSVALCKKHKLSSFCSFILGSPEDDINTIEETIDFAKKLDPDYALFGLFHPAPGSKIFNDLQRKNVFHMDFYKTKWENYFLFFSPRLLPFEVSSLSKKELIKLQKKAFREFYFRPKKIVGFLLRIRSFHQTKQLLRGAFSLITFEFCKVK
ncbi:MAG: B12-binding domain-containing radical SAM protein [Candidatus Omnitrophica bacterium]|nr:B12-binding domain-containing radical SAM protein [Candidatus Omnitrophota bacterium]